MISPLDSVGKCFFWEYEEIGWLVDALTISAKRVRVATTNGRPSINTLLRPFFRNSEFNMATVLWEVRVSGEMSSIPPTTFPEKADCQSAIAKESDQLIDRRLCRPYRRDSCGHRGNKSFAVAVEE